MLRHDDNILNKYKLKTKHIKLNLLSEEKIPEQTEVCYRRI